MAADQTWLTAESLQKKYTLLLERHLPSAGRGRFWWQSVRRPPPSLPAQGWKLHLSATILNASEVLSRCLPVLLESDVVFKVPVDLEALSILNAGLEHGYSQVGKFLTLFPTSQEKAVLLARQLDHLTNDLTGPQVPFDGRLHQNSIVYYRFGSFHDDIVTEADRDIQHSIVSADDAFGRGVAVPDEIDDPFRLSGEEDADSVETQLPDRYHVFASLRQRGRGGVYKAIHDTEDEVSVRIIKQGRSLGEADYAGRDGLWRLRHERHSLEQFRSLGIPVPPIVEYFEVGGDGYIVLPQLGRTLFEAIYDDAVSEADRLRLSLQICSLIGRIHANGCVWRDCKADNFVIRDASHELVMIDLESVRFPEQMADHGSRSFAALQSIDIRDCAATITHLLFRQIARKDGRYTQIDRSEVSWPFLADVLNEALLASKEGSVHLQRIRSAICDALCQAEPGPTVVDPDRLPAMKQ